MNRNHCNLSLSVLILILMVGVVASVVNLSPQSGMAAQASDRDLSTPSSRLAGYWMSERDGRGKYYSHIGSDLKTGFVQTCNNSNTGRIGRPLSFQVLSEELSNNRIVIRQNGQIDALSNLSQKTGMDAAARSNTSITISPDGQSMTEEYNHAGQPMLETYYYVGHKISL